jgi:hypothetical protein
MIMQADQPGVRRLNLLKQLHDTGHETVPSRKVQLRGIHGIDILRTPRAVLEKRGMHRFAKHVFERAGCGVLRAIFACQVKHGIRTLAKQSQSVLTA